MPALAVSQQPDSGSHKYKHSTSCVSTSPPEKDHPFGKKRARSIGEICQHLSDVGGEKGVSVYAFVASSSKGTGVGVTGVGCNEVGEIQALDPAIHAFSLALKECQGRRRGYRDDACMESMNKSSARDRRLGICPSPGAPSYQHGGAGFLKGWSSERVVGSGRRNRNSMCLVRVGNGGELPSKWEDAEKWICSPVSLEAMGTRHSGLPPNHRRPKSKSGPVGPSSGASSYANSPLVAGFDGKAGSCMENSPFSTGVLMTGRGCSGGVVGGMDGGFRGRSSSVQSLQSVVLSSGMHGWPDVVESSCSLPSFNDERNDRRMDTSTAESPSPEISRKDVATQMSPGYSSQSSPSVMKSPPPMDLKSHFSKLEVRDVQVDDRVTVTRWSKKQVARGLDKGSSRIIQWKKKTVEAQEAAWESTEIEKAKYLSKLRREEANITAWENLQKAKAEAEIRKLEMKLEKKRSSSMEKILRKLRSAQEKAQDMRSAVNANQAALVASNSKKALPFRRVSQFGYLSGCFRCHAI